MYEVSKNLSDFLTIPVSDVTDTLDLLIASSNKYFERIRRHQS